nr:uncharacterized protein LOC106781591 [Equus caballus]
MPERFACTIVSDGVRVTISKSPVPLQPPGRTENAPVPYLPGAICLTPREVFTNRSIKETRQLGGSGWEEEVNKLSTVCGGVGLAPHGLLCFRLDKMSFFSSWMKAIFIIVLLFPLHSETSFSRPNTVQRIGPDCDVFKDRLNLCTRERNPICATNCRTYSNPCVFCSAKIESGGKFGFRRYGIC